LHEKKKGVHRDVRLREGGGTGKSTVRCEKDLCKAGGKRLGTAERLICGGKGECRPGEGCDLGINGGEVCRRQKRGERKK